MLNSIFTRYAVLTFIFTLVIVPAFLFFLSNGIKSTSIETKPMTPVLKTTALETEQQEPVIQLASLSTTITDTPQNLIESTYGSLTDIDDLLIKATTLAQSENFDDAMKILNSIPESEDTHYAVNFLEARILAWSGKHYEAEESFRRLNEAYPDNSDILVSQGYLKLYQKNYAQAEDFFAQVLKKNPNYHDAREGLNIALSAQEQ